MSTKRSNTPTPPAHLDPLLSVSVVRISGVFGGAINWHQADAAHRAMRLALLTEGRRNREARLAAVEAYARARALGLSVDAAARHAREVRLRVSGWEPRK